MAASRSSPPSPPPQALPAGGGAHLSLFLDTDLGTHLALNVAADSSIRHLKSQVAVEHAAAFPDLGPVAVKSFQVLRKGALYHLSDSMAVRSAFAKVKAGCFLHVKMAAVETETHCCRYEDRVRSSEGCLGVDVYKRVRDLPAMISEIASDVLPQRLEGGEDAAVLNNVHAHDAVPNDVLLSSSSQQTAERKENEAVSLASDVGTISVPVIDKPKSYKQGIKHGDQTEGAYVNSRSVANVNRSTNQSNVSQDREELHSRKEDLLHSVGDHDLDVVSGNKQVGIKEGTLEEIHALDDLSQEKELKKARKTGSFDTSAAAPIREINDSETRDVNKLDRVPLETNTNSRGVLSSTSFQQEVHGDVQEDSIQLENPIVAGKNKKRKKRQSVKSVVSAQEMTKPSIGAVEEPKTIGEGLLHEDNQGLQGGGAYNVEMTSRDKTMVRPSDMLLSSSQLYIGIQGTKHDEVAVEASDMEKGSKSMNVLETIDTDGNTSQEKNCKKEKKVSSVGIASRDTAEEKDQCGYGEKAVKSDMFSAQGEIANDPYKQQISSDSNVIENPNADGKRKKKRRRHSESSKDDPTQDATKSSGFITKRSSTQNTNSQPLDAKQTTLGTIGEATAEEKDHCRDEKAAKLVIICTQGEIVNDPINVQQGDHNVIENPDGDGKRRKTKRRRLESSKTDPTQDVTKSSRFITNGSSTQNTSADPLDAKQTAPGTIGEATVSDCKKFDESLSVATANVIDEVLADLRCTDSLSKGLHGDPLTEQTHLGSNQNVLRLLGYTGNKGGVSAVLPPKYPAAIQSDAPISSPSHKKSKRKQLKVLSTVLDSSHSSGGVPEENVNTELRESDSLRFSDKISDLKDVLTGNTIAQGDDRTKATKHQRKKISLKHVPTDSGEATQSSGKQVSQVPAEELKGANATKAKLVQGGSVIDTLASAVQKVQQKSKRFSKTQIPKIQEINHSVHGQDSQFAKDRQDEYVSDIGGTHDNENAVGAPTESPVVREDATTVTYDNPNARKGRKKSSKAELRNQGTALEHDSDADLMNSRARRGKVSSKSSADAVEPNDYVAVHPDNDKINFLDHFSPGGTNGPSDSAENNEDETMREVKAKKKSKRKSDKQSHRSGSIEPNDPLESHLHTDKSSLTDHFGTGNVGVPSVSAENNNHFGTGNVGVPSVSAENNNRENGGVKKAKEKKKSKGTSDLVKPESENPSGDHQDTDSCTQNSVYSVVQKGRMGQDNGKEKSDKVIQNNGMLQRETEDATCDSTLEKKSHQSMFDADSQNYLPIDKDHAPMSKEQRNSASQTKHYAKSRNHDGSINGRTGPNLTAVSNIVKSFSMSPPASSESAEGIPHNASRYRVAVRKVPRKRYEQVSDKSKKDTSKRGTGAIFSDAISEGSDDVLDIMSEKAAMETSSDDSSTSADSGISSAAQDGSDVPDDDGIIPLSQRSLKGGLHIGSILRGSSSYKKARQKQTEQLDDIEVPDSQPQDGL